MKIQNLEIRNYKQFTGLKLDLTYPRGHEKEGQPLDKICIIGQSGTGKTNLLEIIKKSVIDFSEQPENSYLPFSEFVGEGTDDRYIRNKFITKESKTVETLFTAENSKINFDDDITILDNEKNYFVSTYKKTIFLENTQQNEFNEKNMSTIDRIILKKHKQAKIKQEGSRINTERLSDRYSIKDLKTIITNIDKEIINIDKEIINLQNKYTKIETITEALDELKSNNFIDRTIININEKSLSFDVMQGKMENFHNDYTNQIKLLTSKLVNDDSYSKEKYLQDLKAWEKENENILDSISDKLNFILNRFNLELAKIDENQKSYIDLIIKDLSNMTT